MFLPQEKIANRGVFMFLHVLRRHEEDNLIVTHFASETVLAKDWNNSIEDEVWRDLYRKCKLWNGSL